MQRLERLRVEYPKITRKHCGIPNSGNEDGHGRPWHGTIPHTFHEPDIKGRSAKETTGSAAQEPSLIDHRRQKRTKNPINRTMPRDYVERRGQTSKPPRRQRTGGRGEEDGGWFVGGPHEPAARAYKVSAPTARVYSGRVT